MLPEFYCKRVFVNLMSEENIDARIKRVNDAQMKKHLRPVDA
jgi:hypothetical protein